MLGLTREWAAALAEDGIRVNAVVPAEVRTMFHPHFPRRVPDDGSASAEIDGRMSFRRRMTEPREIADTMAFLLSRRASHTTGQWVFVVGGYTHLDRAHDR